MSCYFKKMLYKISAGVAIILITAGLFTIATWIFEVNGLKAKVSNNVSGIGRVEKKLDGLICHLIPEDLSCDKTERRRW